MDGLHRTVVDRVSRGKQADSIPGYVTRFPNLRMDQYSFRIFRFFRWYASFLFQSVASLINIVSASIPTQLAACAVSHLRVFIFSVVKFLYSVFVDLLLLFITNPKHLVVCCILRLQHQFPSRCSCDPSFFTAGGRSCWGGGLLACMQASCFFGNRPLVFFPLYIILNFVTQGRTILYLRVSCQQPSFFVSSPLPSPLQCHPAHGAVMFLLF